MLKKYLIYKKNTVKDFWQKSLGILVTYKKFSKCGTCC